MRLSYGGKVQLANWVLFGRLGYWFQTIHYKTQATVSPFGGNLCIGAVVIAGEVIVVRRGIRVERGRVK